MPEIDPDWPQVKAMWEKARQKYPCIGCCLPGIPGHLGRYYRAGVEVWGCVRCAIKWARYLKEFKPHGLTQPRDPDKLGGCAA